MAKKGRNNETISEFHIQYQTYYSSIIQKSSLSPWIYNICNTGVVVVFQEWKNKMASSFDVLSKDYFAPSFYSKTPYLRKAQAKITLYHFPRRLFKFSSSVCYFIETPLHWGILTPDFLKSPLNLILLAFHFHKQLTSCLIFLREKKNKIIRGVQINTFCKENYYDCKENYYDCSACPNVSTWNPHKQTNKQNKCFGFLHS